LPERVSVLSEAEWELFEVVVWASEGARADEGFSGNTFHLGYEFVGNIYLNPIEESKRGTTTGRIYR
jgi:hypothetical protein